MNKTLDKQNSLFLTTKDVAQLMGISVPLARQIMRKKDFPLVRAGKNYKVLRSAFIEWASKRQEGVC